MSSFLRTNYFGKNGEHSIGSFDSVEQCVAAVKEQCSDYDIANVPWGSLPNGPVSSCWCQTSNGETATIVDPSTIVDEYASWGSCMVKAPDGTTPVAVTEEADPEPDTVVLPMDGTQGFADGCYSEWVKTDYFG